MVSPSSALNILIDGRKIPNKYFKALITNFCDFAKSSEQTKLVITIICEQNKNIENLYDKRKIDFIFVPDTEPIKYKKYTFYINNRDNDVCDDINYRLLIKYSVNDENVFVKDMVSIFSNIKGMLNTYENYEKNYRNNRKSKL